MNEINADLQAVLEALVNAPTECRYHGTEFEKLGMWAGEPRCESCRQPYRNRRALDAADRARVAAAALTAELKRYRDAADESPTDLLPKCPNCAPGYDCESGIYTPEVSRG